MVLSSSCPPATPPTTPPGGDKTGGGDISIGLHFGPAGLMFPGNYRGNLFKRPVLNKACRKMLTGSGTPSRAVSCRRHR